MNLLFLTQFQVSAFQGGVQRVTKILSDHFNKNNLKVYFVFSEHNENTENNNINEYKLLEKRFCSPQNTNLLNKIVGEKKIDIIINQAGFFKDAVKLCSSLKYSIPVLSVLHSAPDYELKNADIMLSEGFDKNQSYMYNIKIALKPLYSFLLKKKLIKKLRFTYDNSLYTILLSDKFKQTFQSLSKIKDTSKLIAIPNPIDPEFKYNIQNLDNKEKTVLYVGRINKGKRVDLLLYIWKDIQQSFPDWNFEIVGDGPELVKLKQLANKLRLTNILFHRAKSDVKDYYKRASLFVSASAFEGFPMVVGEAQICGTIPVLYNSYESVFDLIEDGNTGFIVPNLDKHKFTDRLLELMENQKLRLAMSVKCIRSVERFDVGLIGEKWLSLFYEITIKVKTEK